MVDNNDCKLMTARQVRDALGGCSGMHLWRLQKDERYASLNFPRPIRIGARNLFRAREIEAWIDAQAAKTVTADTKVVEPVDAV